jgi:Protein of unknown function (DUF1553)/Protein of unknown function (DUF1549)/Planctomycete cytochrome C
VRLRCCALLAMSVACPLVAKTFEEKVLPILKSNCTPCHNETTRTSGFSINTIESVMTGGNRRGAAVKAGLPAESPLLQLLRGQLKPQMPLGKILPETDIAVIENWIRELKPEDGVVRTNRNTYWAFVKPVRPDPPPVRDSAWVRNPVDDFILNKLEEKGLKPAQEATRGVLIRRLYFDLLGLPPTPEEIKAFVENPSPKAYEELVDNLLKSPRYGERWGRHWLDLARYADTNGYEGDAEFPYAWRYRDYVIDAFTNDKPYDQFIKEQLAGDEEAEVDSAGPLPQPEPEKVVALTFLRLAPFTEPRGEESRDILLSEMVTTTSSVFLGFTVGCAKCHDHKYDQVPTRDFYRMKAFFAAVYLAPSRSEDVQQLGGPQPAEFYKAGQKQWADQTRAGYKKTLESTEAEFATFYNPLLVRLAAVKKPDKPTESKARESKQKESKPLTVKDLEAAFNTENNNQLDLEKKDETFTSAEKQTFASFSERILRLKNAIERVEPLAMSLRNADDPPYGTIVPLTYIQIRGDFDQHGEGVEPGFLSAITGNSDPAVIPIDRYKRHPNRGRRITLANWIASPDNPLTARVMVNRIWQHHFGRGIVETPSDFGKNGGSPSHPELLDWLATQFVQEKWSIKAMHRLILNSSAYRQASRSSDEKALQADPDDRLLWRFPRLRLEGEVIRDSVLSVSGRLNLEGGGPPVYPPLPKGLDEAQRVQSINTWETSFGAGGRKRSIYVFQRRSLNLPLLETFDAEIPNASCDRRRHSVTALQPLAMYDGDFVNTEARFLAERVRKEVGPDPVEQIQRAFLIAYGRRPNATEQEKVRAFLAAIPNKEDGVIGMCRVLLNANEFVYVD